MDNMEQRLSGVEVMDNLFILDLSQSNELAKFYCQCEMEILASWRSLDSIARILELVSAMEKNLQAQHELLEVVFWILMIAD